MKLTDKTKKRLTLTGLGVVCVVLVIAISSQFKTEKPVDVPIQCGTPDIRRSADNETGGKRFTY
jgi:hypothetical protein